MKKVRSINNRTTLIGYIAMLENNTILGNKNSYIVAGSEESMTACIAILSLRPCSEYRIEPITFGDIMERLVQGLTFLFDKIAYQRFLPLGQREGIPLGPENLPEDAIEKRMFIKVGVRKS